MFDFDQVNASVGKFSGQYRKKFRYFISSVHVDTLSETTCLWITMNLGVDWFFTNEKLTEMGLLEIAVVHNRDLDNLYLVKMVWF